MKAETEAGVWGVTEWSVGDGRESGVYRSGVSEGWSRHGAGGVGIGRSVMEACMAGCVCGGLDVSDSDGVCVSGHLCGLVLWSLLWGWVRQKIGQQRCRQTAVWAERGGVRVCLEW